MDNTKHFGKVALGNYVQVNAPTIYFSQFDEMLIGMNTAIAMAQS